ncbi:MAG: gliding motility-associated C-terminal domain-containing protein [Bacteroidetes bacterium]|nr:gliding motility-associated C-terminal domain-containing protein [Bacteroidota bacterium]
MIALQILQFGNAQLAIYGNFFVSTKNELHIAFEDTFFNGGKIITAINEGAEGVVSFGSNSQWNQLKENSFVDGWVRIYHKGSFVFPLGKENLFSPIAFTLIQNPGYVQVNYKEIPPLGVTTPVFNYEIPRYHFWSWKTNGEALARISTFWWESHDLRRLSFSPIQPTDLFFGLYKDLSWEIVPGHFNPNPFESVTELSIDQGSGQLLEPLSISEYKGISFSVFKNTYTTEERLVSQVLTPNNDGVNDSWKIRGYRFTSTSTIQIYELNGTLVFEQQGEYENDWTGLNTFSGEKLTGGSYYYTIDLDGDLFTDLSGWLLIKYP